MKYVLNVNHRIVHEGAGAYANGVVLTPGGLLGTCGLSGLHNFGAHVNFVDWKDKAEWLSCLYRQVYSQGQIIFCITDEQARSSNAPLQALREIGAHQIGEFPNIYHGPRMLQIWHVNIRNACGRFCNKYGKAYDEPPKDDSEVIPEAKEPQRAGYQYLPVEGRD